MLGREIRLQCVLYFDESLEANKRDAQYRINVIYFMSEKSAFHFDFVSGWWWVVFFFSSTAQT